jgi:predicted RNA-binding protein (virulence factor B family)
MTLLESLLGARADLVVRKVDPDVVWLTLSARTAEEPELLLPLPAAEVPARPAIGDVLSVFVHLDSDDRPIATTRVPKLARGEVAMLTVVDVTPFGAFVNWGLRKDLLVPLREHTRALRVGDTCAIGLYLDDTGRLAGTMRVAELLGASSLDDDAGDGPNDWREGVAWREEPGLGLFVILEKRTLALLPSSEPHTLHVGDSARFRITHVHPDRKAEVSLRRLKHEELEPDADHLFALLSGSSPPDIGDGSTPEQIRGALGISKKAFKRAAGRLLKGGRITIDGSGFLRVAKR